MENTQKAFAYLRISTDEQDINSQKHGILEYANHHGITNITFTEDSVSSRLHWQERKIGKIIEDMREGDILLVAETTRLGRNPLEVLEIQRDIVKKHCILHIVKENIIVGVAGKSEIEQAQQKFLLVILGMVGEMERAFISERTKEGLAKRKAAGVKLGRPNKPQEHLKLDEHRGVIESYLKKKVPITSISKILGTSPNTVYSYIERRQIPYEKHKTRD